MTEFVIALLHQKPEEILALQIIAIKQVAILQMSRLFPHQRARVLGKDNSGTKPCLSRLPATVRNAVGAIRVFGFELDIVKETKDGGDTDYFGSW